MTVLEPINVLLGFRDDRELVQQFKGVLAACLCEAFEQLSAEGRHLTRQQQQQADQQQQRTSNTADDPAQRPTLQRASVGLSSSMPQPWATESRTPSASA